MVERLGLGDCKNRMVGGRMIPKISGGERKRASIGFELMTDPKILLFDEPTSGLDSHNALKIIKLLKKEVAQNTNAIVICTLHQPSYDLFSQFDRVICMAEGRQIYNGSVVGIQQYFRVKHKIDMHKYCNPSDFLIRLAHHDDQTKSFHETCD